MAYTKVSIPKAGDGAGCAVPKDPTILLIDVEDITKEPTRTHGNTVTSGDFTLEASAKAIGIYATPASIDAGFDSEGEVDAKCVKHRLSFEHPGDSDAINNFNEGCLNKGFVALVKQCDGTEAGRTKIYGSKCSPLYMTATPTDNKDASKRKFEFKQEMGSRFLPGIYSGTAVAVADASAPAAAKMEGA